MEKKRAHHPVEKFTPEEKGYLLLYFYDGSYEVLSSNSSLLPVGFKYSSVKEQDFVVLKQGYTAKVLLKSSSKDDILIFQRRLTARLDTEKVSMDNSFAFLNDSIPQEPEPTSQATESVHNDPEDSDGSSENSSVSSKSTNDAAVNENPVTSRPSDSSTDATSHIILSEIRGLSCKIKALSKAQKTIAKDVRTIKKVLKKPESFEPQSVIEPVIYKNVDVAKLGSRSFDISQFGIFIARHLFSDTELEKQMLFPKRSSSRPALSPTRSNVFYEAVSSRFNKDAVEEAIRAVNCLGNDLKKGRRKRKVDHNPISE